jgi:hypothetical protein
MAKAPPNDSLEDHNLGVGKREMRNSAVCLTAGAGRYADKHQIRDELVALDLDRNCRPGDIVSLETKERPHDFVILRRRWVIGSAGQQLEITLDHPARSATVAG